MKNQSVTKKHPCYGCEYAFIEHKGSDDYYCQYILMKNKQRPCPPGKGCTVKEKAKKGRVEWK